MFKGKVMAQSVYIGENETVSLSVPNVSPGYVDKAIWACSNPAITFIDKSTTSATIKPKSVIRKSFLSFSNDRH